ncbi:hypothetical protein HY213_02955 [Candidatus Peregrinibacteria bacterium]|nr:hypothetical protein [Candidatus Peregrinibacteria bacterium]
MNFKEILHVWLSDTWSLIVEFGVLAVVAFLLIAIILITRLLPFFRRNRYYETELTIQLGGIGTIKLKSNHEIAQIAHKAWSELITRKAGLPFDPEHDVIAEVYDSWYELFGTIRALIKEVPANLLKDRNTKQLTKLLVDALNKGMRPHLTKWQARFRRWYERQIIGDKNLDRPPQDIQKDYPHYAELIEDLVKINKQLVDYTTELQKLFSR